MDFWGSWLLAVTPTPGLLDDGLPLGVMLRHVLAQLLKVSAFCVWIHEMVLR